jgi:hypothetical protein
VINDKSSFIFGFNNTINSSDGYIIGKGNIINGVDAYVFGLGLTNNTSNTIDLGLSNSTKATIDSTGRLTLRGALSPGGVDGTLGQVLTSAAGGVNTWTSPSALGTIGLTTGTTGTNINVSGSPASLGGTLTLNIPTASAINRGALSATDWTLFNNKQDPLSVSNGLTLSGTSLTLGGTLTGDTVIDNGGTFNMGIGAPGSFSGNNLFSTGGTNTISGSNVIVNGFNNSNTGGTDQRMYLTGENNQTANINAVFGGRGVVIQSFDSTFSDIDESYLYAQSGSFNKIVRSNIIGWKNNIGNAGLFDGLSVLGNENNFNTGVELLNGAVVGNRNSNTSIVDGFGVFGNNNTLSRSFNQYILGTNIDNTVDNTVDIGIQNASKVTIDDAGRLTLRGPLAPSGNDGNPGEILRSSGVGGIPVWDTVTNLGTIGLALGTTGTNINVSGAPATLGGTITLNIPDASATARGVITTGTQTLAGAKTFSSAPTFSTMTNGSVLFAGTGGVLSQDNTNFFWDNTNKRLGIGTTTPGYPLDVATTGTYSAKFKGGATNRLRIDATSNTGFGLSINDSIKWSNAAYLANGINHDYVIYNDQTATNSLFIDGDTNNVGIGTITPSTKFNVFDSGISKNILRANTDTTMALDQGMVTVGHGSTNKPEGLARDQLYVFGRINSSWDMVQEDFMAAYPTLAADAAFGNLYWDESTGSTAQIASLSSAGISGTVRMSFVTPVINTSSLLGSNGIGVTQRSLNPVYEARVLGTVATNHRIVVGFLDPTTGLVINSDAYGTNGAFFRKTAAGNVWQTVTKNAGVETVTTTAIGTGAWHILRVEINDTAGNARFYIDGNLVATHTLNLPAAATLLGHYVGNGISTAVNANLDIDYIRVWSDDPDTALATPILELNPLQDILPVDTQIDLSELDIDTLVDIENLQQEVLDNNNLLEEAFGQFGVNINRYFIQTKKIVSQATLYISEIFAKKVHTEQICLKKSDGSEYCVTGDQLESIMGSNGTVVSSGPTSSNSGSDNTTSGSDTTNGNTDSGTDNGSNTVTTPDNVIPPTTGDTETNTEPTDTGTNTPTE